MPYQAGQRLGGEQASKLGHLDVLQSRFVQDVIASFEQPELEPGDTSATPWKPIAGEHKPLRYIFAVDGSLQVLKSEGAICREVAFVKTALLHLDPNEIASLDPEYPHPNALRKLMKATQIIDNIRNKQIIMSRPIQ